MARLKALDRFSGQLPEGDLWVFGYGSLMWNPGFEYARKHPALLYGYHRALCIYSTRYRGTPEQPGLVMGLARGGSCYGMAFMVERRRVPQTLLALWHREMRNRTYHPRLVSVRADRQWIRALAFTVDPDHANYAGELSVEEIARRIARCHGQRGPNIDYFLNTVAHLEALGVRDRRLANVLTAVRALDPE